MSNPKNYCQEMLLTVNKVDALMVTEYLFIDEIFRCLKTHKQENEVRNAVQHMDTNKVARLLPFVINVLGMKPELVADCLDYLKYLTMLLWNETAENLAQRRHKIALYVERVESAVQLVYTVKNKET